MYWPSITFLLGELPANREVKIAQWIDEAILLAHPFPHSYFHIFCESFPLIATIPPDIVARSTVFFPKGCTHCERTMPQFYELLGVTPHAIVRLRATTFVRNLYIGQPLVFATSVAANMRSISHLILTRLNLLNTRSENILMVQRRAGRYMKNYEQFLDAAKNKFPKEQFVSVIDAPSIKQQVETWRSAKMAVGSHGSAFSNLIWMKPKCVLVIIDVTFCDNKSYMPLGQTMGLKIFATMTKDLHVVSWFEVDIKFMLKIMKMGLDFLESNGM
jgi:hypothetical protein